MKKLNLIEWLSRNSHEKQSPQRFGRYAAMLILFLTCVTHAWATDRDVFIDLTGAPSWYTNPEVNHGTGSTYYVKSASSTNITGIYKVTIPDTDNWEVCRDGGYNKLAWQAYDNGKNMVKVNKDGNGGDASAIIGLVQGGKIYFDNSKTKWTGTIQFVIGHSSYSRTYTMTKKAGTELCYLNLDGETYKQWADATYFAVISTVSKVDDGGWGSGDLSTKAPSYRTAIYSGPYSLDANSQYLITTSSGAATGATITIDYKSAYTAMNYAQTVTLCTKAYGAGSYSANTSSLTSLNFTTYKLDGIGSVTTQQTNNMNGSTGVASGDACQAAITTINVGDAPASWVYDGIYPAMNSGSQVSDDQEFTYYPTAATNYYVRFHEVHDPSVGLAASSSYLTTTSGLRALTGEAITLTATATYTAGSPVYYTYEYSTNGGSTWNSIASNVTNTSKTFTPETTGDYKFRVTLPSEIGTPSAVTNVHVTEMYTIKVKKNASWTPNKLYIWNASSEIKQYGAFPGETGHFTNKGQWYEFELNSDFDSFIISASDHNSNHTTDVNSVTSDGCYAIGGTTGTSCSVSSDDCPTAPTVTLTTTIRQNQITLKGQITDYGNDGSSASDMEEVGFYVGATKHAAVCDDDGYFYKTVTGLTANTQYSIYAFATNAGGTGVSATATPTTLATTATHKLKVQVPNSVVPYVYTYCDNDACGANSLQNAAFPGQAATRIVDGVSNDWYEFDIHDQYDKFIIAVNAEDKKQTANQTNPREDICRWYNNGAASQGDRYGTTDCPVTATSLYYGDKNAATANHSYATMSGTTTAMSKTVSLAANHNYEFKIVYNAEYYGKASTTVTRDGKTNNVVSVGTSSPGAAYIYLTTDLAGDYTITFNETTQAISVTYPEAYVVTFTKSIVGTDNGTTSAPTAETEDEVAVSSGDLVLDGTEVTFTASSAGSGYTWKGWYTVADPSANYSNNKVSTDDALTYTVTVNDAAITVYAVYAEDKHSVSVVTDGTTGSSVSPSSVSNIGIATKSGDISATIPNAAWHFKNWTLPDGVTAATGKSATSNPIQINATADSKTIIANFEPRYGLYGSRNLAGNPEEGMPGWTTAADFTVVSFTALGEEDGQGVDLECTRTLEPNREYKFIVYDRKRTTNCGAKTADQDIHENNWKLDATGEKYHVLFWTAGYGDYTFHITNMGTETENYPSIQIDRPSCHKIVTLGRKVYYNEGASSETATDLNGGTVAATTNENEGYSITTGQYFVDGSDVEFTAVPATGYEVEGWYSDEDCETAYVHDGSSVTISGDKKTMTLSDLDEDITVYVKFAEKMTTVRLVVLDDFSENPGVLKHAGSAAPSSIKVGVHTTYTLTAEADSIRGFYFSKWYKQYGVYADADFSIDYDDELHPSITITGLGGGVSSNQNLSASFNYLKKIYFRNVNETTGGKLWDADQIYVYFDCSWDGYNKRVHEITHHSPMTIENTFLNIYSAYVPRWFTRKVNSAGKGSVAFSKEWMGTGEYPNSPYSEFYNNHGAFRTDYHTNLNMYVPACTQSNANPSDNNGTTYYNNGYWKNYYNLSNRGQGYYLKKWTANNTYRQIDEFVAESSDYDPILKCALRVDNTSRADSNYYRITSAGGENYTCVTITNAACTNVNLLPNNSNNSYFALTPTVEGEYLITIDQTGDTMKISVNYPIAVGDYRLKHSYNDGSAQTSYSDIIKSYQAADDTVSMFIYAVDGEDAGTEIDGSLVLQRCTAITDGKPTWNAGNAVSAYTIANFNKGAGVYKFAVAINTSDHTVTSATDIDLYKGPFYIKTDGADGGWVNYKQNILDKNEINFSRDDASTFDYYFCHFYSAGRAEVAAGTYAKATNIKCVIANDYNNAVSDTLIGDDILGVNTGDGNKPYETLPYQGSVRFSYNSATNEVKRTYLNGSSGSVAFLYLVAGKDNFIYTSETKPDVEGDDVYNRDKNDRKFTDRQNWIYEFTVYAYPTATAGVTTEYDSKTQVLIPSTNELIGGSEKGDYKYMMKLVYDFKTNYIMSAFTPAGDIETEVKDVDVLLVRQGQGAATAITFAKDGKGDPTGSLKSQKIIGALRFNRDEMQYRVSNYAANRDLLKYFVSFPFDVRVRDIFGINSKYGDAYVVSRYAGDKRAAKGFFRGDGTSTFWEELPLDSVMHANVGYVVILDNDYFNGDIGNLWAYNPPEIYLYFPSTDSIGAITPDQAITIDVPQHECKINRSFIDSYTSKLVNHKFTDTDWNLMGVPVFTSFKANKEGAQEFDPGKLFVKDEIDTTTVAYFYEWSTETNEFSIKTAHNYDFLPMHSYMVQYHGKVTFVGTAHVPAAVAARRTPEVKKDYQIELQALDMDEQLINRTYIELRENACDTFAMNEDVYMSPNSNAINVYTFAGDYDVAANVLSINNHIVPVGYNVRRAGSFTFTMPSNFDGTVTLIDTYTGTRTNLALGDYTVSLPNGANNDRFLLEININQAPTAIDGTDGGSLKDGNAHKYIENGVMYILENGNLYDARGNRVK